MMNSNSNEPMSEERLAEIRSRWSMGVVFGTDNYVLTARNYADIGDLLTEVLRLRLREAEYEKQRADYHHIVSELARCEHDHDALLHENAILRSRVAGADQRAARYSEELTLAVSAAKRITEERDGLLAENAALMAIVREVADMTVEDGIYDQPFYALMRHVHETDERWHQQLVIHARALLPTQEGEAGE